MLVVAETGYRIGLSAEVGDPSRGASSMRGAMIAGLLGLTAFLMAFSIGIVISQQSARKEMVVTEANAIGTAWLRAEFLDEPELSAARDLLREYVETRLVAATDAPEESNAAIVRSESIHTELWEIVVKTVKQGRESPIMALFVDSINEVIDLHSLRLTASQLRLPTVLIIALYGTTFLSLLLVGIASGADEKRDFTAVFLFALAFVAVLMIIVDLNRPQQGLITVSQQAMSDLLKQMTMGAQ